MVEARKFTSADIEAQESPSIRKARKRIEEIDKRVERRDKKERDKKAKKLKLVRDLNPEEVIRNAKEDKEEASLLVEKNLTKYSRNVRTDFLQIKLLIETNKNNEDLASDLREAVANVKKIVNNFNKYLDKKGHGNITGKTKARCETFLDKSSAALVNLDLLVNDLQSEDRDHSGDLNNVVNVIDKVVRDLENV